MPSLKRAIRLLKSQEFTVTLNLWTVIWTALFFVVLGGATINFPTIAAGTAIYVCDLAGDRILALGKLLPNQKPDRGLDLTLTTGNAAYHLQCAEADGTEGCKLKAVSDLPSAE